MTSKKEKTRKKKTDEDEVATEKEALKEPVQQAPVFVEPQSPFASFAYPFKVLISPIKAFEKISVHPDIMGILVVIGLLALVSAAAQFSVGSKILLNGTSLVATSFFQSLLISGVFESVFIFFLSWLLFAGPLLLISSILGGKGGGGGGWRPFFVIVGYALTVFILRTVVSAVLISTLPQINFNLSAWPPATDTEITDVNNQINAAWGPILAFQAGPYVSLAFDAWLVFLAAIAVHAYRAVPWSRAATISATAYLIYFTLRLFVGF